jgi:hypothetical protein
VFQEPVVEVVVDTTTVLLVELGLQVAVLVELV